jgi:hypothetical protein
MPGDPTPTERAIDVIVARYKVHFPDSDPVIVVDDAGDWVDALKKHPDVLADLAIEAGGLEQPTGGDLIDRLHLRDHPRPPLCPGCSESVDTTGLPELAYTFGTCTCDAAGYPHLVERIWHMACFGDAAPDEAAVAMLDAAAFVLDRYKKGEALAVKIREFLASRSTSVEAPDGD